MACSSWPPSLKRVWMSAFPPGTSGHFLSMPLKLDEQCICLFLFHFLCLISENAIIYVSCKGSAYFVKPLVQ